MWNQQHQTEQGFRGQGGQFNYIQYRTEQKRQASTDPKDRIHTNPFLQHREERQTATTTPTTTTAATANQTGAQGQHTPNFQLKTIGKGGINTPGVFSWSKQELKSPLNKMQQGTSTNWTATADTVQVRIPQAKPFPADRREEWNRKFSTLHPIPEEQGQIRSPPPIMGDIKVMGPMTPTKSMLDLAERITSKQPNEIRLADITTQGTSEGTTVTVALIMDIIKAHILPMGTMPQMHNLAHFLMASKSESLLSYLREGDKLAEFVYNRIARADLLPPFDETKLFPFDTGSLIHDQEIRKRMNTRDATRADYGHMILPFIQRFYPTETARVKQAIQDGKLNDHLRDIVMVPGYFSSIWYAHGRESAFDPPKWVDLHYREEDKTRQGTMTDGSFEDDDDCPRMLDGFSPMNHMGMSVEDIMKMTPRDQKTQALTTLPTILRKLVPKETAADIMINLAMIPDEIFPSYLQPEGFQKCIATADTEEEKITDTRSEYRIRLRLQQTTPEKGQRRRETNGEVVRQWAQALKVLVELKQLEIRIIASPHDSTRVDINIKDTLPVSEILEGYTQTLKRGKGFDIWCITTCPTWGNHQLPYDDTMGTPYYSYLTESGVVVTNEESYPANLIPCVALVGSDSRDREDVLHDEYRDQLNAMELNPNFQVIWCSLRNTENRSAMIKCIATTIDQREEVIAAFLKIKKATVRKFYPATHLFTMYVIPQPQGGINMSEITEIIMNQRVREDELTRVALTGLNGCNPFTYYPLEQDGSRSTYTLAEKLLLGIGKDGEEETPNPVRKVNTDTTMTRCYLMAPKEDALELITYAESVIPYFADWIGANVNTKLLKYTAEHWIPKKDPPMAIVGSQVTSATSALTSTTRTDDAPINQKLEELTRMLSLQHQQIQQLIHDRDSGTTAQRELVDTITTTMTTAVATIRADISKQHSNHSTTITNQLKGFSESIENSITSKYSSQEEMLEFFQELITQYDKVIGDVNDCTMAYGNEIAMLRMVMDACTHRVNWLVEDIGSKTLSKPPAPTADKLSTRGMEMMMTAAYDVYREGETRVDTGTAVSERCVQILKEEGLVESTLDGDIVGTDGQGRQREPSTPTTTETTTQTHPPQPKGTPMDSEEATKDYDTSSIAASGDGHQQGTVEKKGNKEMVDVQHLARTPPGQPAHTDIEAELPTTKTETGNEGICSCCSKKSNTLVECKPCGQMFHDECITYNVRLGTLVCEQCEEDHKVYQMKEDDSDGDELVSDNGEDEEEGNEDDSKMSISSNESEEDASTGSKGSSYSKQSQRKRKTTSTTKPSRKHPKPKAAATITTQKEKEISTITIEQTPEKPPRKPAKSTQSTLTRGPGTGTIQLGPSVGRSRTRTQTNSLPQTANKK